MIARFLKKKELGITWITILDLNGDDYPFYWAVTKISMAEGPGVPCAAAESFDASCSQWVVVPRGSTMIQTFSRHHDGKIVTLGMRLKKFEEDAEQDKALCRYTGG